jgi:hypothetical protein
LKAAADYPVMRAQMIAHCIVMVANVAVWGLMIPAALIKALV